MRHGLLIITRQQRRVLEFAALGLRDPQIAAVLGVSEGTVQSHFHLASRRLGAKNRTHAVAIAMRAGLLTELAPPVLGVRRRRGSGGRGA